MSEQTYVQKCNLPSAVMHLHSYFKWILGNQTEHKTSESMNKNSGNSHVVGPVFIWKASHVSPPRSKVARPSFWLRMWHFEIYPHCLWYWCFPSWPLTNRTAHSKQVTTSNVLMTSEDLDCWMCGSQSYDAHKLESDDHFSNALDSNETYCRNILQHPVIWTEL